MSFITKLPKVRLNKFPLSVYKEEGTNCIIIRRYIE